LGGGLKGYIPLAYVDTDTTYIDNEQIRVTLREAWNTDYISQLNTYNKANPSNKKGRVTTPFRAVNNAGDILGRYYTFYSCGGPCQTFQSRPGLHIPKQLFGSVSKQCDGTGVPAATGNARFVYDSSDYITYKKQMAINKNYNNLSNGGNENNGSYTFIRAIRRF
jgi:hypothetical protein